MMGNGMVSDMRRSLFFFTMQLKLFRMTMIIFSSLTFCCFVSSSDRCVSNSSVA